MATLEHEDRIGHLLVPGLWPRNKKTCPASGHTSNDFAIVLWRCSSSVGMSSLFHCGVVSEMSPPWPAWLKHRSVLAAVQKVLSTHSW